MQHDGGIVLLVALTEHFNTIPFERRPETFAWMCGLQLDLYQILVYPISQETDADAMFKRIYDDTGDTVSKTYYNDHVIYSHNSLDNGIFHSGIGLTNITIIPVFSAGLLCYDRLRAKELFNGIFSDTELKWHKISPNDMLENCFDGYSMVNIQGLSHLNVKLNRFTWLDLGIRDFEYLRSAGQKYFPLFIQPTRIDLIEFSVRWAQPSCMEDIDERIDTKSSSVDKLLKYFYYNQNNAAKNAAYGNRMPIIFPQSFRNKVNQLQTKRQMICAGVIQRWWRDNRYNPHTKIGKSHIITLLG